MGQIVGASEVITTFTVIPLKQSPGWLKENLYGNRPA